MNTAPVTSAVPGTVVEVYAADPDPVFPPPPGLYAGVAEADYHGDHSSLSSSGAKTLLFSSPAQLRYDQAHPRPPKPEFDFGSAAHTLLLGAGPAIEVIDKPDWKTGEAQRKRRAAYEAGRIPLLAHDYTAVTAMVQVVLEHPLAGSLFAEGAPEVSGWWRDAETEAGLRLRIDWMTWAAERLVLVDYKTSLNAGRRAFAEAAAKFGYYVQHPFYVEGIRALGVHDDPDFVFVTQCRTPPYTVTVCRLDAADVALGHALGRAAVHRFARCQATGTWPDHSDRIHTVRLPGRVRHLAEELLS
ncbi:PD-(D/E)XK nuclease-like domain-containing protein [Nocardia terpenica]|nr:PD-(D/E)XK nuclease-like domain-containing protein [Nocardia terpenica]